MRQFGAIADPARLGDRIYLASSPVADEMARPPERKTGPHSAAHMLVIGVMGTVFASDRSMQDEPRRESYGVY